MRTVGIITVWRGFHINIYLQSMYKVIHMEQTKF
jgi:hypothetical protein